MTRPGARRTGTSAPAEGGTAGGTVALAGITIGEGRRAVAPDKVRELAESISQLGLLNPITITADHRLVAGRHRLEACRVLGWTTIPYTVLVLDDLHAQLAEIDENLIRAELSVLERADALDRRKAIFETLHPETKAGTAGALVRHGITPATEMISFAADTAAKTGQSERSIRQEVQIARDILPEVRDALRNTPIADRKVALLDLSRLEPDQQREVAAARAGAGGPEVDRIINVMRPQSRRRRSAKRMTLANFNNLKPHDGEPPQDRDGAVPERDARPPAPCAIKWARDVLCAVEAVPEKLLDLGTLASSERRLFEADLRRARARIDAVLQACSDPAPVVEKMTDTRPDSSKDSAAINRLAKHLRSGVTAIALKNVYGDHAAEVLAAVGCVKPIEDDGPRAKYKATRTPLPSKSEFEAARDRHFTVSLGTFITTAYSELRDLGDECREVCDSAPDGLEDTPRIAALRETAETLEEVEGPELPDVLAGITILRLPAKSRRTGRAYRCGLACDDLKLAEEKISDFCAAVKNEQQIGGVANPKVLAELEELADTIGSDVETAGSCDFPNMYGGAP